MGNNLLLHFSLSLRVEVANTLELKLVRLISLLKQRPGPCIAYVTLQRHADQVADNFGLTGF